MIFRTTGPATDQLLPTGDKCKVEASGGTGGPDACKGV